MQAVQREPGRIGDCGAVCHSDVDRKLGMYESTVQQVMHSPLARFDRSLADHRRDHVRVDPQ